MSNLAPNPTRPGNGNRDFDWTTLWISVVIGIVLGAAGLSIAYRAGVAKEQDRAAEAGAGAWVKDAVTGKEEFRYKQFFRLPTKDEAGGAD